MDARIRQHRKAQTAARIINAIVPAQGQLAKAQSSLETINTPPGISMALLRAGAEIARAISMAEKAMQRAKRKSLRLAAAEVAERELGSP